MAAFVSADVVGYSRMTGVVRATIVDRSAAFCEFDDEEQEHFVDGITESLTTDHSRISGATVIARNRFHLQRQS